MQPIITQVLLFPVGWQEVTRIDIVGELPCYYQSNKRLFLGYYCAETAKVTMSKDAGIFVRLWEAYNKEKEGGAGTNH